MNPEDIIKEISTFSKDEQLMSTMSLTAAMLCCSDGNVDEAEVEKVKELGKKFFKDKFDFENFQETLKGIRTLIDFSTEPGKKMMKLTASIFKKQSDLPKEERIQIYSFFSEIALSDGEIDPNEVAFLNLIEENLNIKNPFNFEEILKNKGSKPSKKLSDINQEAEQHQKNYMESVTLLASMTVESMIAAKMISKSQEVLALSIAMKLISSDRTASNILSPNKDEAALAFLKLTDQILNQIGVNKTASKPQYSSTVYADTEEELLKKKRAVDFYASVGLLSIFGFIGSFGYAIYLFFNSGNFILWAIIGAGLMILQKWIGKKHDALTG